MHLVSLLRTLHKTNYQLIYNSLQLNNSLKLNNSLQLNNSHLFSNHFKLKKKSPPSLKFAKNLKSLLNPKFALKTK